MKWRWYSYRVCTLCTGNGDGIAIDCARYVFVIARFQEIPDFYPFHTWLYISLFHYPTSFLIGLEPI